jgi:hypothetical protein
MFPQIAAGNHLSADLPKLDRQNAGKAAWQETDTEFGFTTTITSFFTGVIDLTILEFV